MDVLKTCYNVVIVWQVPNSPDSNILDLGAWVALQHQVEEAHRTLVMKPDVLAGSVVKAFDELPEDKLTSVYERWKTVLHLILKNGGGNDLVETCRGDNANVEDVIPFRAADSGSDSCTLSAIESFDDFVVVKPDNEAGSDCVEAEVLQNNTNEQLVDVVIEFDSQCQFHNAASSHDGSTNAEDVESLLHPESENYSASSDTSTHNNSNDSPSSISDIESEVDSMEADTVAFISADEDGTIDTYYEYDDEDTESENEAYDTDSAGTDSTIISNIQYWRQAE